MATFIRRVGETCLNVPLALFLILPGVLAGTAQAQSAENIDPNSKLGKEIAKNSLEFQTPWPINDDDPSAALPSVEEANKQPLAFGYYLMNLTDRAVAAEEAKDWPKARRYYFALSKAAPTRAIGPQKICSIDRVTANFKAAQDSCYEVLFRDGVKVQDYSIYIQVLTELPKPLSEGMLDKANKVLGHFSEKHPDAAQWSRCTLGAHLSNIEMLDECVPYLIKKSNKPDAKIAVFAWQRDILHGDYESAAIRIQEARGAGVPPVMLEGMEKAIKEKQQETSSVGCAAGNSRTLVIFALLCLLLVGVWQYRLPLVRAFRKL